MIEYVVNSKDEILQKIMDVSKKLPALGDVVIINAVRYVVLSRIFDYDNSICYINVSKSISTQEQDVEYE